jgi:MHS family shikimate/dehydroshikimate transporter-like MFS transporter
VPAAIVGGTTPLVATALVAAGGGQPWYVAWYIFALSVVTLSALGFAAVRSRRDPTFFVDI